MTDEGESVDRIEFRTPPVRQVELSVYFEPILGLTVSHLSSFRESIRTDFPAAAEIPPLRPYNRNGDESRILALDSSWPFPYLILSTENESNSVAIQRDRMVRTWTFDESVEYPGFESLQASLSELFDTFQRVVWSEVDQSVQLVGSECSYVNDLGPIGAEELLVGVATEWADEFAGASKLNHYAGLRLHLCDDEALEGCVVNVAADHDDGRGQLGISSEYRIEENSDHRLGGLDLAHKHLIRTFLRFTSDEMRNSWGPR